MAAYTTIDNPELYFQVELWTGTGSENARTLDGDENMQPDFVWIKRRSTSDSHTLYDSVRGVTDYLISNATDAEATNAQTLKSFDSDGFTLGTANEVNKSSDTFVAWCWKANGSGSSNTDGTITSTVSANTTSGFSIAKFTGTGSAATVGHGVGSALGMLIVKKFESGGTAGNWTVWHKGTSQPAHDEVLFLNSTAAEGDVSNDTYWNGADPTSSVFSINTNENLNENTYDYIAYCFAEKQGFSKFDSYTGNGNADGPFIYTGFSPAWVMMKGTNTNGWLVIDNKRTALNSDSKFLYPNSTDAEESLSDRFDFLSNGFKLRNTWTAFNSSGQEYIYMAFAEAPFVNSNGVPCNAR